MATKTASPSQGAREIGLKLLGWHWGHSPDSIVVIPGTPNHDSLLEVSALIDAELAKFWWAANNFGARVKERCPSWLEEDVGSTDFAEARDKLAALLERFTPGK